jgi:hypothetical protein
MKPHQAGHSNFIHGRLRAAFFCREQSCATRNQRNQRKGALAAGGGGLIWSRSASACCDAWDHLGRRGAAANGDALSA